MKNSKSSNEFFRAIKFLTFVFALTLGTAGLALASSNLSSSEQAAAKLTNQVLSSSSGASVVVSSKDNETSKIINDGEKKEVVENQKVNISRTMEVSVEPVGGSVPPDAPPTEIAKPIMTDSIAGSGSVVFSEPALIKSSDLSDDRNPKISGIIDSSLVIEKVEVVRKNPQQSNLLLSGKAQPGAKIAIYIFSSDPIVINIKADDNGNWSYELTKTLADGQHEAYVAIGDSTGKIVSKSQPIAFVKTAEAATMIPVSQLKENQSPMEKMSSQYILVAIVIMLVFLMIALALIGIITHKRNLDETVN